MAPAAFFIAGGASIVSSRRRRRETQISVRWRNVSLTARSSYNTSSHRLLTFGSVRTSFCGNSVSHLQQPRSQILPTKHFPFLQAKHTHIWWLEIKAEIIKNMQMTLFPFTDCHFLLEHCRKECWVNVASLPGVKKWKYKWNLFNISFVSHRYKWNQMDSKNIWLYSDVSPEKTINLMFVSDFNKVLLNVALLYLFLLYIKFGYFRLSVGTEGEEGNLSSGCSWLEVLCEWRGKLTPDCFSFVCEKVSRSSAVIEVVGGGEGGQRRELNVLKGLHMSGALLILLWKCEDFAVWTSAEKDESNDWYILRSK